MEDDRLVCAARDLERERERRGLSSGTERSLPVEWNSNSARMRAATAQAEVERLKSLLAEVRDQLSGALICTGPAQAIMVADAIKLIDKNGAKT